MQPPTLPSPKREKSQWPGAFMFIALLAFIYLMTELFVR